MTIAELMEILKLFPEDTLVELMLKSDNGKYILRQDLGFVRQDDHLTVVLMGENFKEKYGAYL